MEAYIIKGYRSAVGKAKKGGFKNYRSDDLSVEVIKYLNFSKLYQDYSALYTVTDSLGHSDSVRYSGRSDQKLNCEVP